MTPQEANRTIAEYMGTDYVEYKTYKCPVCDVSEFKAYSESLDRLVPVWERLKLRPIFGNPRDVGGEVCWLTQDTTMIASGKTIQEAACIATAKAIREL